MNHSNVSVLELNFSALKHNLNYFKKKLNPTTKLLAVVKAYSYGHDAVKISKFLEKNKVDYLAVAYTEEGVHLRNAGINTPILVLHPQVPNFEALIAYDLEPTIYSVRTLKYFLKIAVDKKLKNHLIHLKFNTGLNRLGFIEKDNPHILKILKKDSTLKVQSIFSHLAASEDPNEEVFSKDQIHKFIKIATTLIKQLEYTPLLHMVNTSGILNYPEAQFDMVRLGIGMYGFGNAPDETSQLKNVASLKSIISQIHELKKGESLGYNRAFIATKSIKTATIPIGHADGISRQLGNKAGHVKIHNVKCPIIGNVCMDMIMIDISAVDCKEGDEVILFDSQKSVNELAARSNTISYEILTGISQRIPRKIIP